MGRKLSFRPGSFYRVDDRSGFPQRAERTKKEWTGVIVDETIWDPRQPQDFVRGRRDDQTVPEPRTLAPNTFVGPAYYQLAEPAAPQDWRIVLTYTTGMNVGDQIAIMLEDGSLFYTFIAPGDVLLDSDNRTIFDSDGQPIYDTAGTVGPAIGITTPMPANAPEGNLVIDFGGTPL